MSNTLEVILNLIDNLTPGLNAAEGAVESLSQSVDSASNSLDSVDGGNLDTVSDAASEAGLDLQQVGEAASMAGYDISSIDPSAVKETSEGANEAAGAGDSMAESFSAVDGVLSALVGVGIGAFLDMIVGKAMQSVDSWELLNSVLDQYGVDNAAAKSQIIDLANSHGFLTSQVRDSTKFLMQAGNTYQDITKDNGAMEAAMAISVATGQDLTSSSQTLQRAYMGQGRQLKLLGIDINDYKDATTGAIDKDRLHAAILSKLGGQLEEHGDSYEAMTARMDNATAKLEVAMGKMLLPVLTPIINGITWLINSFLNLPKPITDIILGVTAFASAIASLFLILGPVASLLGGAVSSTLGIFGLELGSALLSVDGFLAALGPVGWVIAGVITAIAGAIIVWQTWGNEINTFKNNLTGGNWGAAANNIVDSFKYIGGSIYNSLVYAGQQIWIFFANLPAMIGRNATAWLTMGRNFLTWLVEGLTSLSTYLSSALTGMMTDLASDGSGETAGKTVGKSTGKGILDGIRQWLIDNTPLLLQTFILIFQTLIPLIGQLILQLGMTMAVYLYQSGMTAGKLFVNGVMLWIQQLPGRMLAGLMGVVTGILYWSGWLLGAAIRAGSGFVRNFILYIQRLPGRLWTYLSQSITRISRFGSNAPSQMRNIGSQMLSGLVGAITGLPGRVYTILMNIYNKLTSVGDSLYNAAVALGQKIWDGFKDGLGIHSPSYLEKAMDDIIAKSHQMPLEMAADADALRRINWKAGSPELDIGNKSSGVNGENNLNINIDLTGTPQGNSDRNISKMVLDGIKTDKVIREINRGLGKLQTNNKRSNGI